jgi:hypothetical protein
MYTNRLFLYLKNIKFFFILNYFFVFLDDFDILILKIIFKK